MALAADGTIELQRSASITVDTPFRGSAAGIQTSCGIDHDRTWDESATFNLNTGDGQGEFRTKDHLVQRYEAAGNYCSDLDKILRVDVKGEGTWKTPVRPSGIALEDNSWLLFERSLPAGSPYPAECSSDVD